MEIILWWPKTVALFDVWSIDHFVAWIGIGALAIWWINKIFEKYKLKSEIEKNEWMNEYQLINLF